MHNYQKNGIHVKTFKLVRRVPWKQIDGTRPKPDGQFLERTLLKKILL